MEMSIGKLQLRSQNAGEDVLPSRASLGRRGAKPTAQTQAAPQTQATRESASAFRAQSQSDLTVVTAEGDRITISQAALVQYATRKQSGADGSAQSSISQSSSQIRVSVQGNLSEAELKDLGTLLTNLAQATSQAGPSAPTSVAGFSSLSSLAAFSYRYQQRVEAGAPDHRTDLRATG